MTPQDFSREFNIEYNNISSNLAAPLNEYEKSVFLTKALENIVNSLIGSFETNERSRKVLVPLVETASVTAPAVSSGLDRIAISPFSTFFMIPDDVLSIVYEHVKISTGDADRCLAGKTIEVIPVSHDTYHRTKDNPFRGGSSSRAMRLDMSIGENRNAQKTIQAVAKNVPYSINSQPAQITIYTATGDFGKFSEVVFCKDVKIDEYFIRYIRMPKPIVTDTLPAGLYVNGVSSTSDCELDESVHRSIVEMAAEMAVAAYKKVDRRNS